MTARQISAAEIAATVDGLRPLSDQFRAAAEKYDAWAREYSAEPPPDRWSEYNEFDGPPEERLLEIRSRQAGELVYPLLRAGVLRVLPPPDKLLHEPVGIDYLYERASFYDLWWLAFVGWLSTLSLDDTRPTPGESYPTHVFWDWKPGIGVCSSYWLGYSVKCRIKYGQDACLQSAAAVDFVVERLGRNSDSDEAARHRVEDANDTVLSQSPARHSPDFRCVHWFGTKYTFTASQAAIIEIMWNAWEQRTPDISDAHLLERSGLGKGSRLVDIFRNHPAWKRLIVPGERKGTRRLSTSE